MAQFFCAAIACVLGMEIPTAFALALPSREAPAKASARTPTFTERVAYQRAIEEVYWRYRIWPKDNPGHKPPLDAVISQEQIEKKVTDYLRKSQFVTDQRASPISPSELQAEMDRMAQHTKRPEMLRELFEALGNDPFVIAECLARPILAGRLAAELTRRRNSNVAVGAGVSPALEKSSAADTAVSTETTSIYKLPEISTDCTDDTWTVTTTVNVPDVRALHTALWTGSEMIVWAGYNFNNHQVNTLNTGGRYNPATDSWIPTSTTNAPIGRDLHTAVWTGSEMIVWGGYNYPALDLNSGGRYNPSAESWTAITMANAPVARRYHTAVWTGSEMVVWGGRNCCTWFNSGGRYNASNDSWTATSTINPPEARWQHNAEWTGSEMIVWGGTNQTIYLNTGAKYNPTDNSWTPTSTADAPLGRVGHTAIWSGSEMMVWAGTDSTFNDTNTGGRYNPTADSWTATNTNNAPSPRDSLAAVWTGSEMIVWGGVFCCPGVEFNTGGRYNAGTDSWTATTTVNAPFARWNHTVVWTGGEMIAWGGYNTTQNLFFNTGGRYCAQSGATPTPTPTATPTATAALTSTPTATATVTATATPTATPRPTPTPRITPSPRVRPTPPPRP
jgi:N-acetylneuraminic acid mutarotase